MANKNYIQYAARTGKPICRVSIPDTQEAFDLHNVLLVDDDPAASMNGIYIVDGAITQRPDQQTTFDKTFIVANGTDIAVITGLPDPCDVEISGPVEFETTPVTGGSLSFSSDVPGIYTIRITAFPFRDFEVTIHAD